MYDVDSSLRGKKIKIRFNPYDLSYIQVWKDDQRYPDAKPAELRKQSHSKVQEPATDDSPPTLVSDYLERLKKKQEEEKRKQLGTPSYVNWKKKQSGGQSEC